MARQRSPRSRPVPRRRRRIRDDDDDPRLSTRARATTRSHLRLVADVGHVTADDRHHGHGQRQWRTLDDPREVQAILLASLRPLWGEGEPHGCHVQVTIAEAPIASPTRGDDHVANDAAKASPGRGTKRRVPHDPPRPRSAPTRVEFRLECDTRSVAAVRAACTLLTVPAYLLTEPTRGSATVYRFDVVEPTGDNEDEW